MKSEVGFSVLAPPKDPSQLGKWAYDLFQSVAQQFILVNEILNGRLTLGDGIDSDNVAGVWLDITTHVTPGTEFSVTHNLGVVPLGFFVIVPPVTGVINKGATTWTTTTMYLTCTGSSESARIFILMPPTQDL